MPVSNQVSMTNLNQLIKNAQHPSIQHYDGLMKAMFGNKITAIKSFNRLLRWLPYSVRADGAVYKSARELAEETACSEISVARYRNLLEEVGFDIFKKKANGAPTNHFKLNVNRFFAYLAKLFGATSEQIRAWMFNESRPTPSQPTPPVESPIEETEAEAIHQSDRIHTDQPDRIHPVEVIESITLKDNQKQTNTLKEQKTVVVSDNQSEIIEEISQELQVKPSIVNEWVNQYGLNRVQEVIEIAKQEKKAGNIRKSLVGWVRSALKNNYQWEKPVRKTKYDALPTFPKRNYTGGKYADFIES